jgi:arsenate reductase (thioredoxin)
VIKAKDEKIRVLFVCVHNSARSQMAEAFLNRLTADRFEAESAGLDPGELNPLAVEVMREEGIDISANRTTSVLDFYKRGRLYRCVIAVCDEAAQTCPVFPGFAATLHWSFEDPAGVRGTHEERLSQTRRIRDAIKKRVADFIAAHLLEAEQQ